MVEHATCAASEPGNPPADAVLLYVISAHSTASLEALRNALCLWLSQQNDSPEHRLTIASNLALCREHEAPVRGVSRHIAQTQWLKVGVSGRVVRALGAGAQLVDQLAETAGGKCHSITHVLPA